MNDAQIGSGIIDRLLKLWLRPTTSNLRDDGKMFVSLLERQVLIQDSNLVLEIDGIRVGVIDKFADDAIARAACFLLCETHGFWSMRATAAAAAAG